MAENGSPHAHTAAGTHSHLLPLMETAAAPSGGTESPAPRKRGRPKGSKSKGSDGKRARTDALEGERSLSDLLDGDGHGHGAAATEGSGTGDAREAGASSTGEGKGASRRVFTMDMKMFAVAATRDMRPAAACRLLRESHGIDMPPTMLRQWRAAVARVEAGVPPGARGRKLTSPAFARALHDRVVATAPDGAAPDTSMGAVVALAKELRMAPEFAGDEKVQALKFSQTWYDTWKRICDVS